MLEKTSWRFALLALLGFAFSIAVILSTVGIMDGFEVSLKQGLRSASGDINIYVKDGFFNTDASFRRDLEQLDIDQQTAYIQTEGFAIAQGQSKGVLVRGVEESTYRHVTQTNLNLPHRSVAIGSELARVLELKEGDHLALVFASGRAGMAGLPALENYRVAQILHHGIYQTDLRLVFVPLADLQKQLDVEGQVNMLTLNIPHKGERASSEEIVGFTHRLRFFLGPGFSVRSYWSDFVYLLDVVETEKAWIVMIFQIVVVISIFNVLAFVIFINERKRRELFLFKALGLHQAMLARIWYGFILGFWLVACLISCLFVWLFNFLLAHLSFLQLPADVYHLGGLQMSLSLSNYLVVFSISFVWLFVLAWMALRRITSQPILYGLRKEFS